MYEVLNTHFKAEYIDSPFTPKFIKYYMKHWYGTGIHTFHGSTQVAVFRGPISLHCSPGMFSSVSRDGEALPITLYFFWIVYIHRSNRSKCNGFEIHCKLWEMTSLTNITILFIRRSRRVRLNLVLPVKRQRWYCEIWRDVSCIQLDQEGSLAMYVHVCLNRIGH